MDTIRKQSQCICTFNWLNCSRVLNPVHSAFGNYMSDHKRGIFLIILLILPLVRHSRHSWVYSLTYNFSKLNEETENTIRVIDVQSGCGQPAYFVKCQTKTKRQRDKETKRQRDKDKEMDSLFSSWFQCDISDGLALSDLLAQNNQSLLIYFRLTQNPLTSLVALKID